MRTFRRSINFVTFIAVLLLPLSIGLLAHMNNGRRLLQQLDTMRQQERDIRRDIAALPLAETETRHIEIGARPANPPPADKPTIVEAPPPGKWVTDGAATTGDDGVQICSKPPEFRAGKPIIDDVRAASPDPLSPGRRVISWRAPITQKTMAVCQRYDDNRVRLAMIYAGFADWNCLSHKIFSFYLPEQLFARLTGVWLSDDRSACGKPSQQLPPEIDEAAWRSHETWVGATSAVVAGFILPLLLGCLGGCTYVLRHLDRKVGSTSPRRKPRSPNLPTRGDRRAPRGAAAHCRGRPATSPLAAPIASPAPIRSAMPTTRHDVDQVVVTYSFDLRTNEIATTNVFNPSAGREHVFKAYRVAGDPVDAVTLRARQRVLAALTVAEAADGDD